MAQEDCTLLSLPPEIRNIIYNLVFKLEGNEAGVVNIGNRPRRENHATTNSVQALLQTCRQIYGEAAGIFYATNYISIPNLEVETFVNTMSLERLYCISQICVHDPGFDMKTFKFLDYLQQLPNLEKLTIMLSWATAMHTNSILMPNRVAQIQTRVAKLLRLRKVTIDTSNYDSYCKPHLEQHKERLKWAETDIQIMMDRAIVCGKVTRAVQKGWAQGIGLKNTGIALK